MEDIKIPRLTPEQIETLCQVAEKAAREYVLSKIPSRRISKLNIDVETNGFKPITVNVSVEIVLSPLMRGYDVEKLAEEATEKAFVSVERYLRKFSCQQNR